MDKIFIGNEPSSTCLLGDVRLVGGISEREGQVEVCYNGQWGVVCPSGWDEMAANLVCTQLGYGKPGEGGGEGGTHEVIMQLIATKLLSVILQLYSCRIFYQGMLQCYGLTVLLHATVPTPSCFSV